MIKGSCLCGAVRFTVDGPLGAPDACHCNACRKWSGHHLASADIAKSALTVHDSGALRWFTSSEKVRRGFKLIDFCHHGPEHAEVEHVSILMGDVVNYSSFDIVYSR